MNNNGKIINNPIIAVNLTKIRNKTTKSIEFNHAITTITKLMSNEVSQYLKTKEITITTPIAKTSGVTGAHSIILIAILRAGLAMTESFRAIIPEAKCGHIGMYRTENNFQAHKYYAKLPAITPNDQLIIFDPMIATGNTLEATITEIKQDYPENKLIVVSLLTSQFAQTKLTKLFPEITFFTTAIDPELNTKKYLVPGLGDFGDRFFGTI